jgi:hypothetical protein
MLPVRKLATGSYGARGYFHPTCHSEYFSKPIGRIESLRPVLRFRVFLGGDGAIELEVMR